MFYESSEDERSPFYGAEYSEFEFSKKVYNYFIHPQWDEMGSPTLYLKILFANYETGFAVIELIGEWNDCIHNDIMFLKNDVVDALQREGIHKFALITENVMNFHASDDSYYEEWSEDVSAEGGWIMMIGLREHVEQDMRSAHLDNYMRMDETLAGLNWRTLEPDHLETLLNEIGSMRSLEASADE
jgi:hypothetical protein